MARVNAQQWLDKWGRRLGAASTDVQNGIDRVQTAPGVSAAAAQDRMLSNLTTAITDGTWANNVSKVSLQDWKDAMKNKAIPRMSQGITTAQQKKGAKITALLSAIDGAVADTNALPKGGLEQNIARAAAFMRSMAARAPKRQK